MIKYLTVIISDQPIAQREGMPGVIETRAVELPEDAMPWARRDEMMDVIGLLASAAIDRSGQDA